MKFRNLFFAGIVLATAASCSNDDPATDDVQGNLVLKATIERFDTRAAIENGKITWSKGDKIAALLTDNKFVDLTLSKNSIGQASGTFIGNLFGNQALATEGFYAYYPAQVAVNASEVNLPTAYNIDDDFANTHAIMKATGTGNLVFKHLGGVVTFDLYNVPATSTTVRFTTLDNQNITGDFTITTADGTEYITATTGTGDNSSVEANFTALTENSDIQISFPLPVGSYAGIKLEVLDENGEETVNPVEATAASFNIERASRITMPKVTFISLVAGGEETSTWDGTSTETPAYDEATQTYTVGNAAQLKGLADMVAEGSDLEGQTVKLDCNVDLDGKTWTPIAACQRSNNTSTGKSFKGTFDGNGNTISGLTITSGAKNDAIGMFGVIDGGEVKNLTFTDVNINAPDNENAGTVAGLLTNGGKVSNVVVYGSVTAVRGNGGIVGRVLAEGTIDNCQNHATISGTSTSVGGIVGAAYYTAEGKTMTISNCSNYGKVTGEGYVGGIAGLSSANIIGCSNSGNIEGSSATCVGGIIGEQSNAGSVKYCTNTGEVRHTGEKYGTGGIIGWVRYAGKTTDYPFKEVIEVSGNTNTANIYGGLTTGGIVGIVYSFGNIHNNYNSATYLTSSNFVAGIVGTVQNDDHPGMTEDWHVYVTDNISTTLMSNMTGSCKAAYVYINTAGSVTDTGNTGCTDAN